MRYTTSVLIAAAIAVLVAAVLIVGIMALIAAARRRKQERQDYLLSLGFQPVETPPTDLVDKVARLHQMGTSQNLALRNVYHRAISGGDLYLFDIWNETSSQSDWSTTGNLAVVAPTLRMPRLTLMPRLSSSDALGSTLGRLAEHALSMANVKLGLQPVALDTTSGFEQHYVVMGEDEAEVRQFLTPSRQQGLMGIDHPYAIVGQADLFAMAPGPVRQDQTSASDPYTLRIDAERVLAAFRESPVGYLE